jgi:isopenicillin N synthase-like dioxygenase
VIEPAAEYLVKLIRYPGTDDPGAVGVGPHRDTGFLTFVLQDDTGGLQIERAGRFVDVPCLTGSFVVNLGEMLQLVSRGYLQATVHRVTAPPLGEERISAAFFYNPKFEAHLHPVGLPRHLADHAPGGASADPSNPILARLA